MPADDQGTMTSPSLNAMLVTNIARLYPKIEITGVGKTELLQSVMDRNGWLSVFSLGRSVRTLTWHPVVKALVALSNPRSIIRRWIGLERFGHSRNRIALVGCHDDGTLTRLTLVHTALDGGKIAAVNDLFIWGLLVGLLEAAAVGGIEAFLIPDGAEPFVLHGQAVAASSAPLPASTDRLEVTGCAPASVFNLTPLPTNDIGDSVRERLAQLFANDLLHNWTVADASGALALSGRTLQRGLQNEGTTFTEVLKRSRLIEARRLLEDSSLSLTDIAFCVGFSDQSHFTRTFRGFYDVPPSVVRDIATDGPRP